ncbi:MAG TPA: diguanylate cyclase, partial [Gammaproteobacteria bacterium]|nr:diguanylate cyclase [Gammaproteobacteria bacterium]
MTRALAQAERMRILIADATPAALAALLARGGFPNVTSATGAAEALGRLRECAHRLHGAVDVVIIGAHLSDQEGIGLCRTVHTHRAWREVPVILIADPTGDPRAALRDADEAGADDVLFTPVRPSELFSRLLWALSLKRERDLRRSRERALMEELAGRKIMEARLEYLLDHDALTGTANRRGLEQGLDQAVLDARYQRHTAALLYLDLDQFKVINGTEGHAAGDRMLIAVTEALRPELRPTDLLARIGSDDFAVLLRGSNQTRAREIAERLRRTVDELRFTTDGCDYHVSASIGLAMIEPGRITSTSEILGRADQACFIAKNCGRNRVHVFALDDRHILHQLRSNAYWVPLIREALAKGSFQLLFQPVQGLRDGRINHYEVLL